MENGMATDNLTPFLAWLDRHFSVGLSLTRFALNTLLLSLIGLAPVLALYIALVPGFWSHLIAADAALAGFIRQILTNGLPVVVVVNAFGLSLFAQLRADRLRPEWVFVADMAARIGAFIVLHLIIYPGSALMFGSFGGDPLQALRVVGPTLAQSAAFGNLSGVYLYATLVSALPLHMVLAGAKLRRHGHRDPSFALITLSALAVFGFQALLLTAAALLLGSLG
jgi:hypothetical protein